MSSKHTGLVLADPPKYSSIHEANIARAEGRHLVPASTVYPTSTANTYNLSYPMQTSTTYTIDYSTGLSTPINNGADRNKISGGDYPAYVNPR